MGLSYPPDTELAQWCMTPCLLQNRRAVLSKLPWSTPSQHDRPDSSGGICAVVHW